MQISVKTLLGKSIALDVEASEGAEFLLGEALRDGMQISVKTLLGKSIALDVWARALLGCSCCSAGVHDGDHGFLFGVISSMTAIMEFWFGAVSSMEGPSAAAMVLRCLGDTCASGPA